jgi:MFS family permease
MLSQLTPVGEASRGYRYRTTATWFVLGAIVGGATLGAVMAALAAAVSTIGATSTTLLGIAAGLAAFGATVDSGVLGVAPPFFKRQVNEYWLGRYRAWVYGSGFGWQIGTGITTYIMTAAVFVTVAYGALTAGPWAALALGVFFGLTRGLAVLLTASRRTTAELFALHRRFDALGEPVRRAVIVVQLAVAVVAAGAAWGLVAGIAAAGVLSVAVVATLGARRSTKHAVTESAVTA